MCNWFLLEILFSYRKYLTFCGNHKTTGIKICIVYLFPFATRVSRQCCIHIFFFLATSPVNKNNTRRNKNLLVSVFHVIATSSPNPIPSKILRSSGSRAAARVQTAVPAGSGHRVRYAGRFDRLDEGCLAATCNRHEYDDQTRETTFNFQLC